MDIRDHIAELERNPLRRARLARARERFHRRRLLAGACALAVAGCGGSGGIAAPPDPRRGVRYGYYGFGPGQAVDTADHTNLLWLWSFLDAQGCVAAMQAQPRAEAVLDLSPYLFAPKAYAQAPDVPREGAADHLRGFFGALRDAGVLARVALLVPIDEPNLAYRRVSQHLPWAAALMRQVAGEYPELATARLGCIYSDVGVVEHIQLWDVVGIDSYEAGADFLGEDGLYRRLLGWLAPTQQTILLPGGSFGQPPEPFVNFALANQEVWALAPFLWQPPIWEPGLRGIRDLPVRSAYEAAGRRVIASDASV